MIRHILSASFFLALAVPAHAQGYALVAKRADALHKHVVHRLGAARMVQPGGVASLAVSPDGKLMASGDRAGTNQVYIWDLKTGAPTWILQGHGRWVARLEFAADSEHVLASHHADTIHNFPVPMEMVVWNAKTGAGKHHQALDWSISKDGKVLALARANPDDSEPGDVKPKGCGRSTLGSDPCNCNEERKTRNEELGSECGQWPLLSSSFLVPHSSVSSDARNTSAGASLPIEWKTEENLLTRIAFKGFTVDVVDFPSYKPRRTITHPTKIPHTVALNPDGSMLAVGVANEILLYDLTKRKELPPIKGLRDRVHLLRFNPDGKMLASVSDNLLPADVRRAVELWDPKTGEKLCALELENGWPFRHLEFLPDGNVLTQRFLGEYRVWELETQQPVRTLKGGVATVFNDGKTIAHNYDPKYGWAGTIQFEDFATGRPLPMHGAAARLVPWKFSDDGKIVFTRTATAVPKDRKEAKDAQDELVQAWDVATGKELEDKRRTEKFAKPDTIMTKPNHDLGGGREIRYRWRDHMFDIVETETSKVLFTHKVTGFPAWSLSPDKKRVAVFENTHDRRIRVIDLATFKDVASMPVSISEAVHEYLFTPDGKGLAVTVYQGKMRLYDAATGKLRLEREPVGQIVFAPDGRLMAVSNRVGTVDLVELKE